MGRRLGRDGSRYEPPQRATKAVLLQGVVEKGRGSAGGAARGERQGWPLWDQDSDQDVGLEENREEAEVSAGKERECAAICRAGFCCEEAKTQNERVRLKPSCAGCGHETFQ